MGLTGTMRHIGIIYDGSDAEDWFGYLDGMLDLSDRVKLTKDSLNIMENDPSTEDLTKFIKDSKVLVLLLSPEMCETLEKKAEKYSQCLQEHSAVVLIMCFTNKEYLNTFSKHCPACLSWKMLHTSNSKGDNQVMMSEVVEMVDKLQKKRGPPPKPRPKPRQQKVKIRPDSVHEIKEPVALIFEEETVGDIMIGFSDTDTLYNTEQLNPYTYQFKAPSRTPGITKLKIYKDGREIYTCPFTFVEPRLAAYQCTEMLAQCLGTCGHEALDLKLCEIYEKSFSQDDVFSKMLKPTGKHSVTKSSSEIPTILHFAAKNGFSEFCGIILDTTDAMALFETENVDGYNPADLAELAGFTDLAEYIRMFIETAVVVEACDVYYMQMHQTHIYSNRGELETSENEDLDDYEKCPELKGLLPKPQSFKYVSKKSLESSETQPSVHPPPYIGSRPMVPEPTQDQDQLEATEDNEEDLYTDKHSLEATDDNEEDLYTDKHSLDKAKARRPPPLPKKPPKPSVKSPTNPQTPAEFMGMTGTWAAPPIPDLPCHSEPEQEEILKTPVSKDISDLDEFSGESESQRELIEIAEGVKMGEFTIDEAERLYSAWRERNSTQSTSMKERKKMLEEMRNEYKLVFDASKKKDSTFGRLSIFGKIKKWQKRKKSAPDISIHVSKPIGRGKGSRYTKFPERGAIPEDTVCTEPIVPTLLYQRCSTLSNASSSSGGSRDSRSSVVSRESRSSLASRESSISESFESTDSEGDEVTERFDSGMDSDGQSRQSMKVEFLESMNKMTSMEPPPIPPRIGRNT